MYWYPAPAATSSVLRTIALWCAAAYIASVVGAVLLLIALVVSPGNTGMGLTSILGTPVLAAVGAGAIALVELIAGYVILAGSAMLAVLIWAGATRPGKFPALSS